MNINKAIISGCLVRDPELSTTANETKMLRMCVAVNEYHKDKQTDKRSKYANFFNCVLFGSRAESTAHLLAKGMKVAVEGKLRYSTWEKDGKNRSKIEIIVDRLEFISKTHGIAQQNDSSDAVLEEAETVASDLAEHTDNNDPPFG